MINTFLNPDKKTLNESVINVSSNRKYLYTYYNDNITGHG